MKKLDSRAPGGDGMSDYPTGSGDNLFPGGAGRQILRSIENTDFFFAECAASQAFVRRALAECFPRSCIAVKLHGRRPDPPTIA